MKVRQVRLEPIRQRLKRFVLASFSTRFVKRQRVYRVTVGGKTLKRIVFAGTRRPARIAAALEALGDADIFPHLYAQYDEELWVDFLQGTPVRRSDEDLLQEFATLIAALYKTRAREVATSDTNFVAATKSDVELLQEAQVLAPDTARACTELLARYAPERIWLGFDYGDALLKNLLRCNDGKVRFIDVESIRTDAFLGTGLAKALIRWIGNDREALLDRLEQQGAAPFRNYLPAIELAFLAAWTKRSVLQRKDMLVSAEPFRELLQRTERRSS